MQEEYHEVRASDQFLRTQELLMIAPRPNFRQIAAH
jgi:hypothetical protein